MNSKNNRNVQNDTSLTNTSSNNAEKYYSDKNKQVPVQSFLLSVINFSDIESIMPPLGGRSFQNIGTWINNFDDVTSMFHLLELHKFIVAKRSLRGKAQLLV